MKSFRLQHSLAMLTMHQAAEEAGITLRELGESITSGELPCYRLGEFGERVRVLRCELQRYVSAKNRKSGLTECRTQVVQ